MNKKVYIFASGLIILISFALYTFTDFFCNGNCYPFVHGRMDTIYIGLLGLVPTLLLFFFFKKKIFTLWMNHIAWWFSLLTALTVSNTSQGGFLPFYDREQVTLFWMTLLFIVTLIYALIMNKKLKNNP